MEPTHADGLHRVRELASDLMVELQRADGKATGVCAAAAGFLTAGVALLATFRSGPAVLVATLVSSCVLLALAVGAALWAVRPVLPRACSPAALIGPGGGLSRGLVVASIAQLNGEQQLRVEETRLAVLARLARRKFWVVRLAVDLMVAALAVAGMGLLSVYVVG